MNKKRKVNLNRVIAHILYVISMGWAIRFLQRSDKVSADWLVKNKDTES